MVKGDVPVDPIACFDNECWYKSDAPYQFTWSIAKNNDSNGDHCKYLKDQLVEKNKEVENLKKEVEEYKNKIANHKNRRFL